ncbi:hypothetical protein H9Y04_41130 [Streptomyces sp. TRM66268-LWL]|uniref:Uncharacterized protein n=1 Tax=Streptomyces polyasparticus TaxID=2767826 RepID=A0ABR7STZ4_9ACTN|nr:hypothetical protein [Streptomyces polyasparticus]MBC9718950.1 hypothetical protein [Streptomyces polyasparticus]
MTLYFDAAAVLFQAYPSFNGRWEDRLWLNVPGPVYGAETDTCATGRLEAPRHIHYGGPYFTEYVYRQPQSPGRRQRGITVDHEGLLRLGVDVAIHTEPRRPSPVQDHRHVTNLSGQHI